MAKIKRAGVLPYYVCEKTNKIYLYFMKPSDPLYGGPCFQIAKGRIDEGEDAETTAFREGYEELGLKEENIIHSFLLGNHYFSSSHTIYVAKIASSEDFDEPHYETGETAWLSYDEYCVEGIGRDIHKHIVEDAIKHIELLEDL